MTLRWSGLVLRIAWLLLPAHGLETVPAIDRFVRARQKRNFGLTAAIRAHRWIKLARTGRVFAVTPTVATVPTAFVPATRRVTVSLALRPAIRASHGWRKATLGIKCLLSCCKNKLLSAIAAGECLITHSARTLLPWRSTTDGKQTQATSPVNRTGEATATCATPACTFVWKRHNFHISLLEKSQLSNAK